VDLVIWLLELITCKYENNYTLMIRDKKCKETKVAVLSSYKIVTSAMICKEKRNSKKGVVNRLEIKHTDVFASRSTHSMSVALTGLKCLLVVSAMGSMAKTNRTNFQPLNNQ